MGKQIHIAEYSRFKLSPTGWWWLKGPKVCCRGWNHRVHTHTHTHTLGTGANERPVACVRPWVTLQTYRMKRNWCVKQFKRREERGRRWAMGSSPMCIYEFESSLIRLSPRLDSKNWLLYVRFVRDLPTSFEDECPRMNRSSTRVSVEIRILAARCFSMIVLISRVCCMFVRANEWIHARTRWNEYIHFVRNAGVYLQAAFETFIPSRFGNFQ